MALLRYYMTAQLVGLSMQLDNNYDYLYPTYDVDQSTTNEYSIHPHYYILHYMARAILCGLSENINCTISYTPQAAAGQSRVKCIVYNHMIKHNIWGFILVPLSYVLVVTHSCITILHAALLGAH